MKSVWKLSVSLFVFAAPLLPVTALADSTSISQTITVTAVVAPARSIVVNNQGQITKIYSNTPENVTPKVYLNGVPGTEQTLTSALLHQYKQIINQQKNLNGVAIPVQSPVVSRSFTTNILIKTVSSLIKPLSL